MDYPFHLGVTEAGNGEDGRIKSAIGIGSLLDDGIGDTIRVSLTEDPEFEVPVAYHLAERYTPRGARPGRWAIGALVAASRLPRRAGAAARPARRRYAYEPRWTHAVQFGKGRIGANLPAAVIVSLAGRLPAMPQALTDVLALARRAGEQGVRADVLSVGVTGPDDVVTLGKVIAEMRDMNKPFPVIAIAGEPGPGRPGAGSGRRREAGAGAGQDPTRLLDAYLAAPEAGRKPLWVDLLDTRSERELRTAEAGGATSRSSTQLLAVAAPAARGADQAGPAQHDH